MKKYFSNQVGKKAGVYKITHLLSDRLYVGSAMCFNKRYGQHIWAFKNNANSKFLQRVYNKNYPESFRMEILEVVKNKENILLAEQKWLDKYFDNQKKCFNIAPIAGNCLGIRASPEKKKKISNHQKNLWNNKEYRQHMLCLAFNKRQKYEFMSPENEIYKGVGIESFCLEQNLSVSHMAELKNENIKSYKGWRLVKNKNYKFDRKDLCRQIGKKRAAVYDVKLLSPKNEIIGPIINLKQFCQQNNLHRISVRKLVNKKISQTKGWKLYNE